MIGKRFYVLAGTFAVAAIGGLVLALLVLPGHSNEAAEIDGLASAQQLLPGSAGGPSEGIQVHGHWTIEVRNPDGTLASRREFDNALTDIGAVALARELARLRTPGLWRIDL